MFVARGVGGKRFGKAERFNRTMTSEWAFAQMFTSEADRRAIIEILRDTKKDLPPAFSS